MLILASASPRRQELLRQIACEFCVMASHAAEEHRQDALPEELVARNALAKAQAVAAEHSQDVVLGADTTVALDGRIYGKPAARQEAAEMLRALSGRRHDVYTGIALVKDGVSWVDVERTRVYFSALTDDQIECYIDSGEPMDKAGAYAIQGLASMFIVKIEGCYSNVVGLPLYRLVQLFKKAGIDWR